MIILGYTISDEGCQDNSCLVKKHEGVGTNGGCRCFDHVPHKYRFVVKKAFYEIKETKTGRTTRAILDAPVGSYYVWPEIRTIKYVISLAKHLGREDLRIIPLVSFTREKVLA